MEMIFKKCLNKIKIFWVVILLFSGATVTFLVKKHQLLSNPSQI
jgi:hypothetical protein